MHTKEELIQNVFLNSQGRDVISFRLNKNIEVEGVLEKFRGIGTANNVAVKVEGYELQFILPYDTLVYISTPEMGDEARPYEIKPEQYEPKMMNRWVIIDAGEEGTHKGQVIAYEQHQKAIRMDNQNKVQIRTQFNLIGKDSVVTYKYV